MMNMLKKRFMGIAFVLLSVVIVRYQRLCTTAQQTLTQTVKEIATITLKNSAFGDGKRETQQPTPKQM